MKLLLIEDDVMVGSAVEQGLRKEGFAINWVREAKAATLALLNETYALVLLDLGLGSQDGLSILHDMRAHGDSTPVIILTARSAVEDRIQGLNLGADDYLPKPFDLDELTARIRAHIRRNQGRAQAKLVIGQLSMDQQTHEVCLADQIIDLSNREFALLEALMESPGKVLTTSQLEDTLYAWGSEVASNAIEVHIHRLRKKLGSDWIKNIRGVGYKLVSA